MVCLTAEEAQPAVIGGAFVIFLTTIMPSFPGEMHVVQHLSVSPAGKTSYVLRVLYSIVDMLSYPSVKGPSRSGQLQQVNWRGRQLGSLKHRRFASRGGRR